MTYYDLAISTWDSSDTSNLQDCSGRVASRVISAVPTATATQIVMTFIKDALRKRTSANDNLTPLMMRHSQETFSEIWSDPEEDIWDEL